MKTKAEMAEMIEFAREQGLKKIELDGIVFHLDKVAQHSGEVPELLPEDIVSPLSVLDEMSEDEILFWSSPYYDELQAKKQAALKTEI